MNINQIYLEKKLKVLVPKRLNRSLSFQQSESKLLVATICKNLESLGYTFSKALFHRLVSLNEGSLTTFYQEVVPILKKMKGAHRQFSPMYPNFPQQVLDMSQFELYFNALMHYWTNELLEYEKQERLPLSEQVKLDVIGLGSKDDFDSIFTTILASKSSISQSDKDIVDWFIQNNGDSVFGLVPDSIHMKENLGLLAGKLLLYTNVADKLSKLIKTPTDVLRVAVSMSGGDVSLAQNTKFGKFKRKERRFLLGLLEKCSGLEEGMLKYKGQWIRLGEKLHPGEYSFERVSAAFHKLRNNKHIDTFNSSVEAALKESPTKAMRILSERPGELARRLDHLFRLAKNRKNVFADEFLKVANKVSTPVLLQVYSHFKHRHEINDRAIFPKGTLAKLQVLPPMEPFSSLFCEKFSDEVRGVLVERFKELPRLGKVYLDEKLQDYLVPFSERSASKALKTIVRGSKLGLDGNYDTIRFFIWWKNGKNRVDIDLSAAILKENWDFQSTISYYNLKEFGGHHSGDIVTAPNGASEFIDISLNKVLQSGGRYVVMVLNSFTQQPYCDLPECFAGWMGREKPNSGEIFEVKTVKNKIDIASDTRIVIPLVIDCLERKVIWCDLGLKNHPSWVNNVVTNKKSIGLVCKALSNLKKTNLYELFDMHVEARGRKVNDETKADLVLSADKAFETNEICSKYL